jgi:hypothetical protein
MDGDRSVVMVMRGRAMLCGIVAGLEVDRKAAEEEAYEAAMRYIPIILLALSAFVCISCGPGYEQEEANVYSSYINKYYITQNYPDSRFENKPFSMIVIGDRTSGFVIPFIYPSSFAELDHVLNQSTLKNFLDRNDGYYTKSQTRETIIKLAGRYPLNRFLKFGLPHTLVSENEINQIFGSGKWDEFYRRYPTSRGLVFLSRVGFNKTITQALLYFVKEYDGGAGEGSLILFEKNGNEWTLKSQVDVWIS